MDADHGHRAVIAAAHGHHLRVFPALLRPGHRRDGAEVTRIPPTAIRKSVEETVMVKIAMMGAGSAVFVKNLLTDILAFKELGRVVIALHDIDAERLETGGMMARWTAAQFGADAVVEEHLDRRKALDGCDFVINMVQIGMHESTMVDFDIPRKYGLKQTIAD